MIPEILLAIGFLKPPTCSKIISLSRPALLSLSLSDFWQVLDCGIPKAKRKRKLGLHWFRSAKAVTKLFSSLLTFGGQIWLFMLSANALLFFIALPVNNSDLQPFSLQGGYIKQSLITSWNICSCFKMSLK